MPAGPLASLPLRENLCVRLQKGDTRGEPLFGTAIDQAASVDLAAANCELRTVVVGAANGKGNLDPTWFHPNESSARQQNGTS